jgi:hypothetical protein
MSRVAGCVLVAALLVACGDDGGGGASPDASTPDASTPPDAAGGLALAGGPLPSFDFGPVTVGISSGPLAITVVNRASQTAGPLQVALSGDRPPRRHRLDADQERSLHRQLRASGSRTAS